ncbi:hypothetical protein CB1_001067001 [Camelus ferus]|nr:hypothetical protein CB1_001067001 [Camelus ferus]
MDHVISYYHVASDTEKIISEGPTDLTSSADDLEVQEEAPLEHLPESMLQDMVRVSRWLVEYGRNQDFVNIYYQIRSSQLDRSIKGLKEPFWKSISSSVVAYSSARGDTPTKRKDTPTKKPVKQPVLTVFPTLQHLKQTNPKFDHVLQGTATSSKNKTTTCPSTVHKLRSNATLFLQQLLNFQGTAGAMLASQETSSSAISYNSKFSRHLLSIYICKVLGNLQLNLLSKSKVYEDQALSAIFLHENYNYILKALEKSELIQLVAVTQNTAKRSYQEHIEQQIQTYQCSCLKVTDYIPEKKLLCSNPESSFGTRSDR